MKKLLSIVLSLLMICAVLPGGALAQTQTESDFVIKDGVLMKYTGTAKKVVVPDGVTIIGAGPFNHHFNPNCENIVEIQLPDSVTTISSSAFSGCKSLSTINLPDSITSIGKSAFWCCESLTEIDLPDSLVSVGFAAFWGCTSLSKITFPVTLSDIGDIAFETTPWFENQYEKNGLVIVNNILLGYGIIKNGILYIPDGITAFVCDRYNAKAVVIPPSVTDLSKFTYGDGRIGIVMAFREAMQNRTRKK